MRRALLYVGGWLAAVVIATGVGFAAVSLVGDDVGAPGDAVALVATTEPTAAATEGGATAARPTSTSKPRSSDTADPAKTSPTTTSARATSVTDAATVTGLCRGDVPRLVTWSPRNGWSVLEIDGVGARRSVSFSDGNTYLTVTLRCVGRVPTFTTVRTDASPSPEPTSTDGPTPTPTVSVDPGA